MKMPIIIFRKTKEELRKLDRENDIKLLRLLKYLRRRNKKPCNLPKDSNGVCSHLWGADCNYKCCKLCPNFNCNSRCRGAGEEIKKEETWKEKHEKLLERKKGHH